MSDTQPRCSTLRVRQYPQAMIVEVVRDGEVVARIYGSDEGVQIMGARLDPKTGNSPFFFQSEDVSIPCYVVPLLAEGEKCPWCDGSGVIQIAVKDIRVCPLCKRL
jgi:hypothetical protein